MPLQFQLPPSAVANPFDEIPLPVRDFLATGFSNLAALPAASLETLAGRVSQWLDPQYPHPKTADIAHDLKVEVSIVDSIVPAVAFQATTLFASVDPIPLDSFVAKATAAGILKEQHLPAVRTLGEKYRLHHEEIRDALVRAQSSTHTLPSFANFDATIDLRLARVESQRVVAVPIAMALLQTDVKDEQLIFQMTLRDVDQLQQKLKALAQKLAESNHMTVRLESQVNTEDD